MFPEERNEYSKVYLLDFKQIVKNFTVIFLWSMWNSWENHSFEKKEDREKSGKIVGKDYEPFTNEQLQNLYNE